MVRELLLLRHGKSDWSQNTNDYDRPLKDRGKRAAQRMGIWLQQQDLVPDYIVSSPAVRAIETARKACKVMGIDSRLIKQDPRVYAAGVADLLKVLRDSPDKARRVMLVGHNPGMEDLLLHLASEKVALPDDGNLMPTACLAHFKITTDWGQVDTGSGQLQSIKRPKTLPKKFPYPDFQGEEQRDRPAYYYNQSSVIPYRVVDGRPEILVVRSSQKKHWVVPKGITDPGLTLQETAAKEALEEAGVEGEVESPALGSYTYEKWGSVCTVHVYPMAVTRILPDSQWEESHRGRQWLSPEQAMKQVRQAALKPMIETLGQRLLDS